MKVTENEPKGSYQYRALHEGHPLQRAWHRMKIEWIRTHARIPAGGRILDVGCGSGVITDVLAQKGAHTVGVDVDSDSIAFAERRFGGARVEFRAVSIWDMEPEAAFDAVFLVECLEHFSRSEAIPLLRHLRRMCRQGGSLFVTTPNQASLWPVIEWLVDLSGRVPPMRGAQHLTVYTPARLKRVVQCAGWRVLDMGSFNGLAPFAAWLSPGLGRRLMRAEQARPQRLHRNLLYVRAMRQDG